MTTRSPTLRGADIVAKTLQRFGVKKLFSLSGNHIMPVYDALIDTDIEIIHVRHEAACVHMADAYSRLNGTVGFALVTGGQGHANAAAALYTAITTEAPVVLLSGHASLSEVGLGAFQELRQAELAAPLTKAAWTAQTALGLGHDLARAAQIAGSGRPGPVHLSLPFDLLEQRVDASDKLWPEAGSEKALRMPLPARVAERVLAEVRKAKSPLILCGPTLCSTQGRASMKKLEALTSVPVIGMESPRGINDPGLGAFAEILKQADTIVLVGKPLDFTLRFAKPPFVSPDCALVVVDPDAGLVSRAAASMPGQLLFSALADPWSAMRSLTEAVAAGTGRSTEWLDAVEAAVRYRPDAWRQAAAANDAPIHPLALCRALQTFFDAHPEATLVCDGGEIGQWPQAAVRVERRLINGVAGSIGPSLPFALAARIANPRQPVVAVMGDGTFGFHMAEFDTAVRYGLPVIVVVGNDARWNAEYQIQLRDYGVTRARGCELLPSRYDRVAEALGGHGEYVTKASDLDAALERAHRSGKPACINVLIESVPAPVIRMRESGA